MTAATSWSCRELPADHAEPGVHGQHLAGGQQGLDDGSHRQPVSGASFDLTSHTDFHTWPKRQSHIRFQGASHLLSHRNETPQPGPMTLPNQVAY